MSDSRRDGEFKSDLPFFFKLIIEPLPPGVVRLSSKPAVWCEIVGLKSRECECVCQNKRSLKLREWVGCGKTKIGLSTQKQWFLLSTKLMFSKQTGPKEKQGRSSERQPPTRKDFPNFLEEKILFQCPFKWRCTCSMLLRFSKWKTFLESGKLSSRKVWWVRIPPKRPCWRSWEKISDKGSMGCSHLRSCLFFISLSLSLFYSLQVVEIIFICSTFESHEQYNLLHIALCETKSFHEKQKNLLYFSFWLLFNTLLAFHWHFLKLVDLVMYKKLSVFLFYWHIWCTEHWEWQ
jgi:hypothetical protein